MRTVRLTVGQAIVRFMAAQDVERDGRRHRFIAGVWGIFGHGNVAGLGQAIEEYGDVVGLPYYRPQNEQAQVHIAHAFAKYHDRLRAFACISSVGPGATNMITAPPGRRSTGSRSCSSRATRSPTGRPIRCSSRSSIRTSAT